MGYLPIPGMKMRSVPVDSAKKPPTLKAAVRSFIKKQASLKLFVLTLRDFVVPNSINAATSSATTRTQTYLSWQKGGTQ